MDNYSNDLIKSVANDGLNKFLEDYVASGVDGLISHIANNEITDTIPIIKTIFGVSKGIVSIRDHIYIKKIFEFLFQTNRVSDEAKVKFANKLKDNPDEVNRAGEAVWEILDSISSSEKSPMIGKVFESYMNDEITIEQLIYLSEMIAKSYLYDLQNIIDGGIINRNNLINIGVYEPVNYKKMIDDDVVLTGRGLTPDSYHMQNTPLTKEGLLLFDILKRY